MASNTVNASIINHLFLPLHLPSSAAGDYLIRDNHEHEHELLECVTKYFQSIQSTALLPAVKTLADCIEQWCIVQNPRNFSAATIQRTIERLPPENFLPLYLHAQNAAILMEIDAANVDQPLISAWQVLLPTGSVTPSCLPHVSCFPVSTYRLHHRSQLSGAPNCELLVDLLTNTVEYSQSCKASRQVNETRDVPKSHYVCQWWIQHFDGIRKEETPNEATQFKKKHRDQIRWNGGLLPFRRSGLWMTVKVVFHTILIKRLGQIGTLAYKLLLTHFLTHVICTGSTSTDLAVHCMRKIVRRLNKIESLLEQVTPNEICPWMQMIKQEIEMKVREHMPKPDWQISMPTSKRQKTGLPAIHVEVDESNTYQHSCSEFRTYLTEAMPNQISGSAINRGQGNVIPDVHQEGYIPSMSALLNQFKNIPAVALTCMEIWVALRLEEWFTRPATIVNEENRFQVLLRFFEEYQDAALAHYCPQRAPTDPAGYSRFILTSLSIIRLMHECLCRDPRFDRLKLHRIDIPNLMQLFEYLTLPTRDDMVRARRLYVYFTQFKDKTYPDLLTDIERADAFGVDFASRSEVMQENIRQIQLQAERDKLAKIEEVMNAKRRYQKLIDSIRGLSCTGNNWWGRGPCFCSTCSIQREADRIEVEIFECPMPEAHESASAVIFELQMPIEIRCYRDVLWQFANRPTPTPGNTLYRWLDTPPHATKLNSYYSDPVRCKVQLVSSTKSFTQSHYSHPPSIATASVEDFLFKNGLKVQISPTQPISFQDERPLLTPQLEHADYKPLQFTLSSTQFVQNDVMAQLSKCSIRMKPSQFVEFGSFRSGHRLQWWNLLTLLEMDSLSLAEESVAILIVHSILQYGPLSIDHDHWCTESHQQLLEDHYVDELLARLDRHLNDIELNWQHELALVVITMIVMRILTVCSSARENETLRVVLKCRQVAEKWIELINASIQSVSPSDFNSVNDMRWKIIHVAVGCLLTFSTHRNCLRRLLTKDEHVITWLQAVTTLHDNLVLGSSLSTMRILTRNIMRLSGVASVIIQPVIAEHLQATNFRSLNDFSALYWAANRSKGTMDGQWQKRHADAQDGWYDCRYQSRWISIDCIQGSFLVDDMTVGFLPQNITSNALFQRVFGSHVFEVQAAELPRTYITKHSYHGEQVQYEFHYNDQTHYLIIYERNLRTKQVYQLIPYSCFEKELADTFISDHSHWWDATTRTLIFRPVHFQHDQFLTDRPHTLNMETGHVTTNDQVLVNQASAFFQDLFNKYFSRMDEQSHVYMMREQSSQSNIIVHIHLSRFGLAFQYNSTTQTITSREYSDMHVDTNQHLGTLTGLSAGLLLSPIANTNHGQEYYPYRKLLMPYGRVRTGKTVIVQRTSLLSQFLRHYFVFVLNDRLNIVQSTDSPTGWLYLALLHAVTSHPLPDEYTQMTGMERAFQLLHSAGCQSDEPYDTLSLDILTQIASISPKVNYYPAHLTCMVQIKWNSNDLPYSMQHFGYYLLAQQLIVASRRFSVMHPSSAEAFQMPDLFKDKSQNETLLKKLYWNYREYYNPLARLSVDMEAKIRDLFNAASVQSDPEHRLHVTDYPVRSLVNDLYASGDVSLAEYAIGDRLPLAKWLSGKIGLKRMWIGMLQLAYHVKTNVTWRGTDDIQRYEDWLDFLHYVSSKQCIQPYYLQLLRTFLTTPTILLTSISFPPLITYECISEVSFQSGRIDSITWRHESEDQETIVSEAKNCFRYGGTYSDRRQLLSDSEKSQINGLFTSWRNNSKLRSFLRDIQRHLQSVTATPFNSKPSYHPQQFDCQSRDTHHHMKLKSSTRTIDLKSLAHAEQQFHYSSADHFNKAVNSTRDVNHRSSAFPQHIFSSNDDQDNNLSELTDYFRNQLEQSWKKLHSDKPTSRDDPSLKEIRTLLDRLRRKSTQSWNELTVSVTASNELLFEIGLMPRTTPTVLVPLLLHKSATLDLTDDQRALLGGTLVSWTCEQQLERALHFAGHGKQDEFRQEISNSPHSNWKPSEHIPWLILELEMNITIRDMQVKVAQHMMNLSTTASDTLAKNSVMQMNMGEGKTSVIIPMLSVSLPLAHSRLVRIIVLKSLFPTNYQSLKYKLGGLLNRRVFPFFCRRDLNYTATQIQQIHERFREAIDHCDVILTSPEDILSFDLLTIDKCRRAEFDTGRSMLTLHKWLKTYVRDVLDESDEILHVKYQLIYTVGTQQQVDGGAERWKTIQTILELLKKHAASLANSFANDVCYKPADRASAFPSFRLQSSAPFAPLCHKISTDWLEQRALRQTDRDVIRSFLLNTDSSIEQLKDRFAEHDIQLFLIMRGLLASEVLLVALKKRHRVNYGVNFTTDFNRLIAVPFRAKDVAADRTEFGHPDVALVLTHLTYYYSGLNDSQLTQCFGRLTEEEIEPASIYEQWITYAKTDEISPSIRDWKGVNLKDYVQRTQHLFPTFRHHMLVINYFLNHFVFPREAKQFPHKLVASAWDLSSSARSHIITGFSGTNDTQLLLPVHIQQKDLPELQKTDAIVVSNLLRTENERYQDLPINVPSNDILHAIIKQLDTINVILDVGALFIDGSNRDIAVKWLNLSDRTKVDYAVYFDRDRIVVCDRHGRIQPFAISPASERLDRCVFYLDDIHTRGTDFKFPTGFRAAVTLGNGLTKDRFVQACMRMRKLGRGHSLSFWSSHEVHQQIAAAKRNSSQGVKRRKTNDGITVADILRWVYENTVLATWDGLHHWATQSLSFQRKLAAFRQIVWSDDQQLLTEAMMQELARASLEAEIVELRLMYGATRTFQDVHYIHTNRYRQSQVHLSQETQKTVLKRLLDYGGTKQRLSQLLDEEQQRELEQELEEERQVERPPPVQPCQPILHEEIKRLCDTQSTPMDLGRFSHVFRHLSYAFSGTTFASGCSSADWTSDVWVSTEFQRVIKTQGESLDPFLRPPRWLVYYRNEQMIFVNAFEANWLMGCLQSNKSLITTLRLVLPRMKKTQSILVNTPTLVMPPAVSPSIATTLLRIPLARLVQFFIFNGTLYFENAAEQNAFCQCLSLCPKPRTKYEEDAFETGWIAIDGYVSDPLHRSYLGIDNALFQSNPLTFTKTLLSIRNNSHASITSHVGSIILKATKLLAAD